MKQIIMTSVIIGGMLAVNGCTSIRSRHNPDDLRAAQHSAFSLAMQQQEIITAVSPVRQTMQIGGTIPTLLGAGISAVQDNHYAVMVKHALGEYDPCALFKESLASRLQDAFQGNLNQVSPMGTAAGHANLQEAQASRLMGLQRAAYDYVLDLELRFGIYGPQGILAVKVDGELTHVASSRVEWRNTLAWYSVEHFADTRWRDPMRRATPNITAPRLSVAEDAITQWTVNEATPLKCAFEKAVNAVADAVLTDLGLAETTQGWYVLGSQHLLNRRYEAAATYFKRILEKEPEHYDAANGLALALARNKQLDEAIAVAEKYAVLNAEHLPLHYNLAWWYAVEKKDPEQARPYYEQIGVLGASPGKKLKRAMK